MMEEKKGRVVVDKNTKPRSDGGRGLYIYIYTYHFGFHIFCTGTHWNLDSNTTFAGFYTDTDTGTLIRVHPESFHFRFVWFVWGGSVSFSNYV